MKILGIVGIIVGVQLILLWLNHQLHCDDVEEYPECDDDCFRCEKRKKCVYWRKAKKEWGVK